MPFMLHELGFPAIICHSKINTNKISNTWTRIQNPFSLSLLKYIWYEASNRFFQATKLIITFLYFLVWAPKRALGLEPFSLIKIMLSFSWKRLKKESPCRCQHTSNFIGVGLEGKGIIFVLFHLFSDFFFQK